jgi:hypothetical protein
MRTSPWVALEFFKSGDLLRFHRHYSREVVETSRGSIAAEVAVLLTPTINASVQDPSTEFAYARDVDSTPSLELTTETDVFLWRFLKGLYCLDGDPILKGIERSEWNIKSVKRNPTNHDWVDVEFSCTKRSPGEPRGDIAGDGLLTLSPPEDWSIREYHFMVKPPANYNGHVYIEPVRIPGAGFVPKSYRFLVFKGTDYQQKSPATNPDWIQSVEYELSEASARPTPASEFALAALGIGARPWTIAPTAFLAVGGLLIGSLLLARRFFLRANPAAG